LTDEKLIEAVLAGNNAYFRELVVRYESRVAATVISMLGRNPEAEDVGQETFIQFYKNLKKFRGESSVATYLTRIAINLSLNALKSRKRRSLFFSKNSDDMINIPDKNKKFNDEKDVVHRAIQKLEPKFRAVIILRMIEEYSTKETADILELPMGTVLSRLSRAQQKLKKLLSPYLEIKNETKNSKSAVPLV